MVDAPSNQQQLFKYTARDRSSGDVIHGEQSAESAYAVRNQLRHINLDVESINPVKQRNDAQFALLRSLRQALDSRQRQRRINQRADLYDALATMLRAGMPLEQALHKLSSSETRRGKERSMLLHIRDRIREGSSLSEACAIHPDWFDPIDVAMIGAGQDAGELAPVLTSLSVFLQERGNLQHQLFAALIYPLLLLCAAVGVSLFLAVYTLPQLMTMLEGAQLEIPTLTNIVASIGQSIWHFWWAYIPGIIACLVGLFIAAKRIPRTSKIGTFINGNIIIKTIHRNRIAQVASTLARLQRSGIPLADALDTVSASAPSEALKALLADAAEAIRNGQDFSQAMNNSHLLDEEFAQLLQLGEESGELPSMLEQIAERYKRAAERSTKTLSALLEPVAVLSLAVLIGCIAMAAVLPLIEMTKIL